jgi:hypothetical protein
MKTSKLGKLFIASALIGGVAVVVMNGCSSGSSDTTLSVAPSTLDSVSVQKLAQQAVDVGSCTSVAVIPTSVALSASSVLVSQDDSLTSNAIARAYDIDETIYGLISGTLHKYGQHDSGTTSLTYDYNNFTNPIGDIQIDANGSSSVIDHGISGDLGPTMINKTIDTLSPISIIKSAISRAVSATYLFNLSGYNRTYATTFGEPDDFVIKTASLTDENNASMIRTVSNVSAKANIATSKEIYTNVKASYTDPLVGTIYIESDSLTIDKDSMNLPSNVYGTLALRATDGTEAEAVISNTGSVKIYTVEGTVKTLVSEVDCSNLIH